MSLYNKDAWSSTALADVETDMPMKSTGVKRPGVGVHINRIANGWIVRFSDDNPVMESQWWEDLHYCKSVEDITPILLTRLGKDRIAK